MAGDWIKMRVWLSRDPRVIGMADFLAAEPRFLNGYGIGCLESKDVTRNVTVALCVTGLLVTWGTAREQGDRENDDLVVSHCKLTTLDAMTGLPFFGSAMRHVEWAIEREDGALVFPKFFKDNESPDDRHRRQNADRQARFRANKDNAEVTPLRNVTVTHREEKRREEVKPNAMSGSPETANSDVLPIKVDRSNSERREAAREILGFLNAKTGRNYRLVDANLGPIMARMKEGATRRELRAVIARKCREWGADEKMAQYLRPATLFNATKFNQYVGEVPPTEMEATQ